MNLKIHQVDSFSQDLFKGNPAAVIILERWLDDALMQAIAIENNLSETAFLVPLATNYYFIRWFSPICEIDFCGHATLAAAHVLFEDNAEALELRFSTSKVGELSARRAEDHLIAMDFPIHPPQSIQEIPDALLKGVSIQPSEILRNQQAYFLVYDQQAQVESIVIDEALIKTLGPYDVVVTAKGRDYDFVSRYFWPANGGYEDPVTGSIYAGLTPFWAARLDKKKMVAYQASNRGGVLHCALNAQSVTVAGHATTYMQGTVFM
ncbi:MULTISPECIES: PhzF family phenazine biosynthesis protein [unclassified Agarivorans]|uniref:PhzF family phenazine biosynthesis protein n=1 Tax=unclassified Agarivorans TaxID=2636026 RepID=UPI0026E3A580|nr:MULTISPECIES: PhzF family phenazine biosynthesis protein [unclassified Agarivorans]MDO6685519.1 PhzF family phenazine biosynthesis protein [Agarivorans sp. 3_MG-2023]MDO6715905.1 PhzF family phenazine biosynthesis protein [Agarivorans sp. 2_MG-2023]